MQLFVLKSSVWHLGCFWEVQKHRSVAVTVLRFLPCGQLDASLMEEVSDGKMILFYVKQAERAAFLFSLHREKSSFCV